MDAGFDALVAPLPQPIHRASPRSLDAIGRLAAAARRGRPRKAGIASNTSRRREPNRRERDAGWDHRTRGRRMRDILRRQWTPFLPTSE